MQRVKRNLSNAWRATFAVAMLALLPVAAEAAGIGFRNDAPYPVYVQSSIVVNGQIKRGPLLLIKPGQTVWDVNLMKGNITISVYNTANQKLYQDVRVFQGNDQLHAVVPMLVPPRQPPRVDLKELPLPPMR
jgi:hypothetical protein